MKMQKLERDMPKYLRAQRNYLKQYSDIQKKVNEQAAKALGISTEEFLQRENSKKTF